MSSCAFFGHANYDYQPYEEKIRDVVVDLINRGVTSFYNGYRGHFDVICARVVGELREQYPQIKNIMVLSYRPGKTFELPQYFNEAVYLLEQNVPFKYAIPRTNREIVRPSITLFRGLCADTVEHILPASMQRNCTSQ